MHQRNPGLRRHRGLTAGPRISSSYQIAVRLWVCVSLPWTDHNTVADSRRSLMLNNVRSFCAPFLSHVLRVKPALCAKSTVWWWTCQIPVRLLWAGPSSQGGAQQSGRGRQVDARSQAVSDHLAGDMLDVILWFSCCFLHKRADTGAADGNRFFQLKDTSAAVTEPVPTLAEY